MIRICIALFIACIVSAAGAQVYIVTETATREDRLYRWINDCEVPECKRVSSFRQTVRDLDDDRLWARATTYLVEGQVAIDLDVTYAAHPGGKVAIVVSGGEAASFPLDCSTGLCTVHWRPGRNEVELMRAKHLVVIDFYITRSVRARLHFETAQFGKKLDALLQTAAVN